MEEGGGGKNGSGAWVGGKGRQEGRGRKAHLVNYIVLCGRGSGEGMGS